MRRMTCIGILANPAAGKDVRRIVAHGFSVDNEQKVSIVRRAILGAVAVGCERILLMPDSYGIGWRAVDGLPRDAPARAHVELLDLPATHNAADTMRAARRMEAEGAGCLITLGGDGTVRLAGKATPALPVLPLSTGTNNVLPTFTEGTVAGMAAALVAGDAGVRRAGVVLRAGLVVWSEGWQDLALVDVAALRGSAVGARAVWDWRALTLVAAVRPRPDCIGLSAIVGTRLPGRPEGGWVRIGEGLPGHGAALSETVLAAIAPGLVMPVPIAAAGTLAEGEVVSLGQGPMVVALDGERELVQRQGEAWVRLAPAQALIVDPAAALAEAAARGLLARAAPPA